jgi:hypothetical protein
MYTDNSYMHLRKAVLLYQVVHLMQGPIVCNICYLVSVLLRHTGAQSSSGPPDVPGLDEGSNWVDGLWGNPQPRDAFQLRGNPL